MSRLVARDHDWKMLEDKLKNAKAFQDKQIIVHKMDALRREAEDPEIANLREQLVNAARTGDNQAGDRISEQIYKHQYEKGIIKNYD